VLELKEEYSYTSTFPLGLQGLFYGELYLIAIPDDPKKVIKYLILLRLTHFRHLWYKHCPERLQFMLFCQSQRQEFTPISFESCDIYWPALQRRRLARNKLGVTSSHKEIRYRWTLLRLVEGQL